MANFSYTVNTGNGQKSIGIIQASSLDEAKWVLLGRGLQPERLQLATETDVVDAGGNTGFLRLTTPGQPRGVKPVHIALTLRQLAVMLRSGLTLLAALDTIIDQPPSRAVRKVFQQIRERLESGIPLADALDRHNCFPKSVVSMVGLGEASGNLEEVLYQCADTMESTRRNKVAVLTAMIYPLLTLTIAISISVYMVLKVIPPLKLALEALGRPMPAMTQSLLDLADFVSTYGVTILIILLTFGLTFLGVWLWPPGRLALDRIQLRVPIFGSITRTSSTALFSRLLATLLRSGIPLVESLQILTTIHRNQYLVKVVDDAREAILQGGALAEAINKKHAYLPMMNRMIGVGEASGNLEEILLNVAEFHDDLLQALIKKLGAVLVPVIVLIVGFIVGYVYLAFFIALYGSV